MLAVTDAAVERLEEMSAQAPEGVLPRVQQSGDKLMLAWDRAKPRDQQVSHSGSVVLVYDESLDQHLADKTLDVVETDQGAALAIT